MTGHQYPVTGSPKGKGRLFLLVTIVLFAWPAQAGTMYVRPLTEMSLRQGQGSQFKTVGLVRAGDEVEVLEEVEGWARVRTLDGKEGWFARRQLAKEPSGEVLSAQPDELARRTEQFKARIEELNVAHAEEREQLTQCLSRQNDLEGTHNAALEELEARHQLEQTRMNERIRAVEQENTLLRQQRSVIWFLAGGGVLVAGWLIGYFSRRAARRWSKLS